MPAVSWHAAADGRYWIDVEIGGHAIRVMVDLGLVDPLEAVGFEIEPALFDQLKQADRMTRFQYRFRRDANARITGSESGHLEARLLDPVTKRGVGPRVYLHVCRGMPEVPSRVGVVFFHRLADCRVRWELAARTWQIEFP